MVEKFQIVGQQGQDHKVEKVGIHGKILSHIKALAFMVKTL